MDQAYWLGRKRASMASAGAPGGTQPAPALSPAPVGTAHAGRVYYQRLEAGARWLAGRAASAAERHEHLGMANKYARLGLDVGAR